MLFLSIDWNCFEFFFLSLHLTAIVRKYWRRKNCAKKWINHFLSTPDRIFVTSYKYLGHLLLALHIKQSCASNFASNFFNTMFIIDIQNAHEVRIHYFGVCPVSICIVIWFSFLPHHLMQREKKMSGNAVKDKNAGHIFHVKRILYPHVYAKERIEAKRNSKNKTRQNEKKKNNIWWNPVGNAQIESGSSFAFVKNLCINL